MQKNNYAYSWKTDQAINYSIKKKNVKGYKGIVSSSSNEQSTEYIITNTSVDTPSTNVKTGDSTRINHWIMLMSAAGLLLIVLGKLFKHVKD